MDRVQKARERAKFYARVRHFLKTSPAGWNDSTTLDLVDTWLDWAIFTERGNAAHWAAKKRTRLG